MLQSIECNRTISRLRQYLKEKKVVDANAINLLEKMLTVNPDERITIREILNDIYLNDPNEPPCEPHKLPRIQTIADNNQN